MKFLFAIAAVLSLGVLAALGHGHHGHEAVSYSVVTKHEDHHGHEHGHEHHAVDHAHGHEEHHENYVSHGHQEHHGHEEHHGQAAHHGHEEHHSHGNNGDDDHHGHHDEHNSHAKYEFKYGVKDPKTGDVKQQWESRDGHVVKGSYSLKEADGTTRVVNYSSDKKKGFEATVHKIGHAHHEHHGHQEHHHGHH